MIRFFLPVLVVIAVLGSSNKAVACHAIALVNTSITLTPTGVLTNASSDSPTCGCGNYWLDVEVECNNLPFANTCTATNTYGPFVASLTGCYGSTQMAKPSCIIQVYPQVFIPYAGLCPGTTYKLRMREHHATGVPPVGPWSITYTFVTPGAPPPPMTVAPTATPATICGVQNVQLNANTGGGNCGTISYTWSPATFLNSTTIANPLASNVNTTITYTVTASNCLNTTTSTVTITFAPTPISGTPTVAPNPICSGQTSTLTLTGFSGNIQWQSGPTSAGPWTNLIPGNTTPYNVGPLTVSTWYHAVVTNACGSSTSTAILLTVNPLPTVTSAPASICGGGCTNLTASGASTYTWSPATALSATTGATVNACPTVTTTYTITGTSIAGCTSTATVTVSISPNPTVTVPPATICSGNCATLTASGANTYTWSPATALSATTGASVNACPTTTTTYTVTGTAVSGCTDTQTVTVTVNVAATLSMSMTPVLCNGGSTGTATVVATGGNAPYTYAWAPSGGNASTATGLSAGNYTVTVTTANGCTSTATITVTQPTILNATVTMTPALCFGGNTGTATVTPSGGTPAYTYAWAPSGGNAATATGLAAGTYTVTVTDANGCTRTATIVVTQPTALTASTTTVPATCGQPNGSATVTVSGGTPGYTYSWAPSGGNAATATGLTAGLYVVTITDANGCTVTASANITNAGSPTVTITGSTNVLCFGGSNGSANSFVSGGTGPYSYAWTPSGGNAANATGLSAGTYTITVTDANGCVTATTVIITQPPLLTVTAVMTPVLCNGGNTGTATATAGGGTTPYTYAWSPSGGNASTATGLTAQTYTITVTDANGCTATATVTVTQPTALTATTVMTPVLCFGGNTGTATVTAGGGTPAYTYAWAPSGGNAANATGLTAGTYTVTVTDANGCTRTATIVVTQPTALTATTTFIQSTCGQANGSASVTVSGGTPAYTYAWAPSGGNAANATGLIAGIYTVTITDANGCTLTATATVPSAASPVITVTGQTNVACFGGNNGSATTNTVGGTAPYTYNWTPTGGNGSTGTGLSAGTYTVTVTDVNGCSSTATVTITQPTLLTVSAVMTPVLCFGGNTGTATSTATGGTTPYTYAWTPSGGNAATATGLTIGTYTITVTDANGCTATATVTVNEPPQLVLASAGFSATCFGSCNGQAVVIPSGGTGPFSYLWSSGGTNPSEQNLCVGTYTITVTDANGCSASDTAIVSQPTQIVLATTTVTANCGQADGSATVTATGGVPGYTYLWQPTSQTTPTATNLSPNTYTITVTDANGCTMTTTAVVPNTPGVVASIPTSTNVSCFGSCDGTAISLATSGNGPYTYAWAPSGGNAVNASNLCANTYTVTITDASGCTSTATVIITQPALLVATATNTGNVLCFGGANGSASVTETGGTGPYTYAWAPSGGNTSTATGLAANTYTVTVTDVNGCSATTTIVITQPTLLVATAGNNQTICFGQGSSVAVLAAGGTPGYTYLWTPGGMTTANANVTPTSTTVYTVLVTDANGCTGTSSMAVNVNALPVITFTSDDTAGCVPICINFTNTTPNSTVCFWDFGNGSTSNICNPTTCYNTVGAFAVTLTVTDGNGCVNTLTIANYIDVYPLPVADLSADPTTTTILNPTIIFTDLSAGSVCWNWNFGDIINGSSTVQNPVYTYLDTGVYLVTLVVCNQYGCTASDSIVITILNDFVFYAPNAFTPDGDGLNETWFPEGIGVDKDKYNLWIYDRWGNLIWQTDVWGKGWDGTANGGSKLVQEDVYVWKVQVYDIFGKKHQFVGSITMVR